MATHRKRNLLILPLVAGLLFLVWPHAASAQYVDNNLVDDNIFLNAASMTQGQVQTFLQGRGGYIANYSSWSDRDGANVPASQIIWEAAQTYGINPQVILATLQKEQSLVTATNPTSSQLNYAMGYGCPDSSGCSGYVGLYNQVENGTWQLRYNLERARGNNTWWRTSSSYACGAATRYYSTGLYVGRNVTFYDDYGTGYKTFTLNDAATASMYCYTPHAYPGSAAEYYSGSYNFVVAFEQWFGSTQPALVVSSPLRITDVPEGVYAGSPVTASFDLTNQTGAPITANVAVTVRDSNGGNHDYALKTLSVPAHGIATYTDTQAFSAESTYTFGLTSFTNGAWSNTYPVSSNIDNPRTVSFNLLSMPTITASPSSNVADMRVGKAANLSFTVKNNSSQTMTIGKMALAMRDPSGLNVDAPLLDPGTIAAGSQYVYSAAFTPQKTGTYRGFITLTKDNGVTWDESAFPAAASGTQRTLSFTVNPSPTLTQGPTLSIASPHVGQQVTASFKVKNFGDSAVNVGYIGIAIRDPQGRNVDAGGATLTVNPNTEYTFQATPTFQTPGTYTTWITVFRNGAWDDTTYPTPESSSVLRKITFTVLPSPTITVQPTVTTTDPRVGKALAMTFTVHNYGSGPVDAGSMAIAVRDPQDRNVDLPLQSVAIPAAGDYTYNQTKTGTALQTSGTYTAWITVFRNGAWDDTTYPAMENGSLQRRVQFTVNPSPTLTQGPTLSIASPHVGQQVTASFKVKNFGDSAVNVGYIGIAIRDPQGRNVDAGGATLTVNPNTEYTFQATPTFQTPGTYTTWITVFRNGAWDDTTYPTPESSSVLRKITFTVLP